MAERNMIVVVEGDTDLPYIRKLVGEAGFAVCTAIASGGCGNIDRDLGKYNDMAKGMPIVVLRDR
jgi:5S rRNA maturation endonuclease (ribonuclease M5)